MSATRLAAARAPGGGPGDQPSEQHRQIDRQLTERLEHHRVLELADIGIAGSANAIAPTLPAPCDRISARKIAVAALGHSIASPGTALPSSARRKGSAT
jgi:hypothetical protein